MLIISWLSRISWFVRAHILLRNNNNFLPDFQVKRLLSTSRQHKHDHSVDTLQNSCGLGFSTSRLPLLFQLTLPYQVGKLLPTVRNAKLKVLGPNQCNHQSLVCLRWCLDWRSPKESASFHPIHVLKNHSWMPCIPPCYQIWSRGRENEKEHIQEKRCDHFELILHRAILFFWGGGCD